MQILDLKNKKILILGLGREGLSTLRFLRKQFPVKIIGVADQKQLAQLAKSTQKIITSDKKIRLHLGKKYQKSIEKYDTIFKSPGIRLEVSVSPEKITSQANIFIEFFRDKIIGVTGTKGKSTTSSLIYKILKDAKIKVELIGNIGNPPFDYLNEIAKTSLFVYELSSYQLEFVKQSPHISVFLNLFKEHTDYHGSFKVYHAAKSNIFKWQNENDYLIYNSDFKNELKISTAKSKKIPFNIKVKNEGAYVENGYIVFEKEKILKTSETKLKGRFNLNNILAAVAVSKLLKISNQSIALSIKSFNPLKHRLEYIGTFNQISFYNDSIATIPEATIAAIETLSPRVGTLILGGLDRSLNFSALAKKITEEKIGNIILFPQTGEIILEEVKRQETFMPQHFFAKDMKEAVEKAYKVTPKNSICLMSPAASSYNMFKNYEDRGRQFVAEVNKLK